MQEAKQEIGKRANEERVQLPNRTLKRLFALSLQRCTKCGAVVSLSLTSSKEAMSNLTNVCLPNGMQARVNGGGLKPPRDYSESKSSSLF